jgi:hypothetical protein
LPYCPWGTKCQGNLELYPADSEEPLKGWGRRVREGSEMAGLCIVLFQERGWQEGAVGTYN